MRKKTLVMAVIITSIIGLGAFAFSVYASPGGWGFMMNNEWRENIKNTFENNDYDAWKNLMQEKHNRMLEWMTEERFSKMSEMRALMREGKFEEANKIREELGLPERSNGEGGKFFQKRRGFSGGCWR